MGTATVFPSRVSCHVGFGSFNQVEPSTSAAMSGMAPKGGTVPLAKFGADIVSS
jgi:hypothetical protein